MEFEELKQELMVNRWVYIEYVNTHTIKFIVMFDYEDERNFIGLTHSLSSIFGNSYNLKITDLDGNHTKQGLIELGIDLY